MNRLAFALPEDATYRVFRGHVSGGQGRRPDSPADNFEAKFKGHAREGIYATGAQTVWAAGGSFQGLKPPERSGWAICGCSARRLARRLQPGLALAGRVRGGGSLWCQGRLARERHRGD